MNEKRMIVTTEQCQGTNIASLFIGVEDKHGIKCLCFVYVPICEVIALIK